MQPKPLPRSDTAIVILDGFTANPGDISWAAIEALGNCKIYDRTGEADVVARAADADIVLTNKTLITQKSLAALPRLRYIGVLATGYNTVDVQAAQQRGILVCNVPEYSTPNVTQAVFALLLELTNRTGHHSQTVHEGRWSASPDFCYWDGELVELAGRTLGIVGYGRIGKAVAAVGSAFGMQILAHRRTASDDPQFVSLDRLLCESDVVSLHCPLVPDTKELINAARLAQMKLSAFLINTARGALIHEPDLAAALNAERIAGAGLDVLSVEPPLASNPLLSARNCVLTPHIAWATRNARLRLLEVTAANIRSYLLNRPQNVITP